VIAVLGLSALDGGSLALGATPGKHKRAHRATRCGGSARSVKARSHSKRHGRISCTKHHSKLVKHSTRTTSGAGSTVLSRSADNGAGGCANAGLAPTTQNLELIRGATLCLVNRERALHGEAPLLANPHLQQAAQGHTTSMVVNDYFEHIGPGGQTPLQRMREAGYISGSQSSFQVGENIAWGTLWLGTPRSIVAAWMASPGHRANILDEHFRDTGIGVSSHPPRALGGGMRGGVYTQDFGVVG
jgi:uncharacterized protein YkwD